MALFPYTVNGHCTVGAVVLDVSPLCLTVSSIDGLWTLIRRWPEDLGSVDCQLVCHTLLSCSRYLFQATPSLLIGGARQDRFWLITFLACSK